MSDFVLITGGAGFIGQHLALELLKEGKKVRVLDNFNPQIHATQELKRELSGNCDLLVGDVRDSGIVDKALKGVNSIVHLAAETGTGQSMYEIARYFDVNSQGTAVIFDAIQRGSMKVNLESIVVASSRAIYGEGAYNCLDHGTVYPSERGIHSLASGRFEPSCPYCGLEVTVEKTKETARLNPLSIYGLTKQIQEQTTLLFAKMLKINAYALRYQNVYGPGQSLKNPYTGILAVFSNLARINRDINIFEDGNESRDFIYIDDVIRATKSCLRYRENFNGSLNVGYGDSVSVLNVARQIKEFFQSTSEIKITGEYREGDIRHNIADISNISKLLGFKPEVNFDEGLKHFLTWASKQDFPNNSSDYEKSIMELRNNGFMHKLK